MLEAARSVVPVVLEHADACEAKRTLTEPVVAALQSADLFRLLVPAVYGGPECDPVTYLAVIEEVAAADGAAGWCSNIASTTSSMSWFLPEPWAREIYSTPRATGGAFAPNGKAARVEGGWRVTGRWSWGSGTQHSGWVNGGAMTDTGEFHLAYFDLADVHFIDNWYSTGLRGTGSCDFEVTDAFVPDGRSVLPGVSAPVPDAPLARFPNFSLLAAGVASTTLGIARHAIAAFTELAEAKTPQFARSKLADYAPAQLALARAEAGLSSARAFLRDEVALAWETVLAGSRVPVAQRARIRLACTNAAEATSAATGLVHRAAGGSAVYQTSPLERCFRDINTATAHLLISDRNLVTYARLRLGLEADTSML